MGAQSSKINSKPANKKLPVPAQLKDLKAAKDQFVANNGPGDEFIARFANTWPGKLTKGEREKILYGRRYVAKNIEMAVTKPPSTIYIIQSDGKPIYTKLTIDKAFQSDLNHIWKKSYNL